MPQYKLVSFNITTNIPVEAAVNILENILKRNNSLNTQEIHELLLTLDIVLKQNNFMADKKFFIQEKGLAMRSPLLGLLVYIYF